MSRRFSPGGGCRRQRRPSGIAWLWAPDLVDQRACPCRGHRTELLLKQALQHGVLAQCGGSLAHRSQEPDQLALRALAEWIDAHLLASVMDRLVQVARLFPVSAELAERLDIRLGKPVLLCGDPLLIPPREQLGAI